MPLDPKVRRQLDKHRNGKANYPKGIEIGYCYKTWAYVVTETVKLDDDISEKVSAYKMQFDMLASYNRYSSKDNVGKIAQTWYDLLDEEDKHKVEVNISYVKRPK